jgi:hypothetical protein
MSYQATKEKPTAAYVLSLIGGILSIIGAVVSLFIATILLSIYNPYPYYYYNPSPTAALLLGIGIWFFICGAIVIVAASKLNSNPEEHMKWGTITLVFSILGGGIFALIGGILAMVWKPSTPSTPPPPPWQQGTAFQQIKRICPQCGRVLTEEMKFCPYCGKELGG